MRRCGVQTGLLHLHLPWKPPVALKVPTKCNITTSVSRETLEDVSEAAGRFYLCFRSRVPWQVVFFLLGALTIVEIMDAHKGSGLAISFCGTANFAFSPRGAGGDSDAMHFLSHAERKSVPGFDIITKLIQAKTQRELLVGSP